MDKLYGVNLNEYCKFHSIEIEDLINKTKKDIELLEKNLSNLVHKEGLVVEPLIDDVLRLKNKKEKHLKRLKEWNKKGNKMNKVKEMLINMHSFVDKIRDEGYDELANDMSNYIDEIIKAYDKNNSIKQIEQWQKYRLLDKQEYNSINEFTNIYEELLEANGLKIDKDCRPLLKQTINNVVENSKKYIESDECKKYVEPTKEDIVDAYFDIIVFSIGAIMKLGYKPECVLQEGIKHINSRTGKIVDGKFQKDLDVKTYEPEYNKCKRSK